MRPAQDCLLGMMVFGPKLPDPLRNSIGLAFLIGDGGDHHCRLGASRRVRAAFGLPDLTAGPFRLRCEGGRDSPETVDDWMPGPIVDAELSPLPGRIISLEGSNICRRSASESVDALPVVADGPKPCGLVSRQ